MSYYIILSGITIIALGILSFMDLKERQVYVYPVIILHLLWCFFIWNVEYIENDTLAFVLGIHIVLYFLLGKMKVWGNGDSDILFLLADAFLSNSAIMGCYEVLFWECIGLAGGLLISSFIYCIEKRIKKERMPDGIAVIPGLSIVISSVLLNNMSGGLGL